TPSARGCCEGGGRRAPGRRAPAAIRRSVAVARADVAAIVGVEDVLERERLSRLAGRHAVAGGEQELLGAGQRRVHALGGRRAGGDVQGGRDGLVRDDEPGVAARRRGQDREQRAAAEEVVLVVRRRPVDAERARAGVLVVGLPVALGAGAAVVVLRRRRGGRRRRRALAQLEGEPGAGVGVVLRAVAWPLRPAAGAADDVGEPHLGEQRHVDRAAAATLRQTDLGERDLEGVRRRQRTAGEVDLVREVEVVDEAAGRRGDRAGGGV